MAPDLLICGNRSLFAPESLLVVYICYSFFVLLDWNFILIFLLTIALFLIQSPLLANLIQCSSLTIISSTAAATASK